MKNSHVLVHHQLENGHGKNYKLRTALIVLVLSILNCLFCVATENTIYFRKMINQSPKSNSESISTLINRGQTAKNDHMEKTAPHVHEDDEDN